MWLRLCFFKSGIWQATPKSFFILRKKILASRLWAFTVTNITFGKWWDNTSDHFQKWPDMDWHQLSIYGQQLAWGLVKNTPVIECDYMCMLLKPESMQWEHSLIMTSSLSALVWTAQSYVWHRNSTDVETWSTFAGMLILWVLMPANKFHRAKLYFCTLWRSNTTKEPGGHGLLVHITLQRCQHLVDQSSARGHFLNGNLVQPLLWCWITTGAHASTRKTVDTLMPEQKDTFNPPFPEKHPLPRGIGSRSKSMVTVPSCKLCHALYVAVPRRKRTLFRNAIIEKNTIKNINIYRSRATIVQQL